MSRRAAPLLPALLLCVVVCSGRFSYSTYTGPGGRFFYWARHGGSTTTVFGGSGHPRHGAGAVPSVRRVSTGDQRASHSVGSGPYTPPAAPPSEPQLRDAHEDPCARPRQSPININTCQTKRRVTNKLFLTNFQKPPTSFNLTNTGKDVMTYMTWQGSTPPTISGAGLPGKFVPFAIDFHWGANDSFGSEHTVDGGRYQLELHIQCANTKYDTLQEALGKVDGIAVLGVFYSLDGKSGGRGFTAMAEAISQVREVDTTVQVPAPPTLGSLLSFNLLDRAQYRGSLTGAPYSEVVHWVILLQPARILASELGLLRALRKQGGEPIGDTFRMPQARCGRKVFRTGYQQLIDSCSYSKNKE